MDEDMPQNVTPDLVVDALNENVNEPLRRSVCTSVISMVAKLAENTAMELPLTIPAGLCDEFQNGAEVQVRIVNTFSLAERTIRTLSFKPLFRHTDGIICKIDGDITITMIDDRICLEVQLDQI